MVPQVLATITFLLALSISVTVAQDTTSLPAAPQVSETPEEPGFEEEARREFEATDARLRGAYDSLLTQLNVEQRVMLEQVQSQWLAFREQAAKTTAALISPSEVHTPLLEVLEMHRLTEQRLEALERVIEARKKAG